MTTSQIITGIQYAFAILFAAYCVVALMTIWLRREWAHLRFLPLLASIGLATPIALSIWLRVHSDWIFIIPLPFLAAVVWKAWHGSSRLDRSLRMLSTFWFLYISIMTTVQHFELL